jgi:hypothetical protein
LFARYSLIGAVAGAFGTLAAALPDLLAGRIHIAETTVLQSVFWFYAAVGLMTWVIYRPLTSTAETQPVPLVGRTLRY